MMDRQDNPETPELTADVYHAMRLWCAAYAKFHPEEKRMNVYLVEQVGVADGPRRLVKAANKAAAMRFVAADTFEARLATQADMYGAAKEGIALEDATTDKAAEATQAELRG